jgi:hypothetical protein
MVNMLSMNGMVSVIDSAMHSASYDCAHEYDVRRSFVYQTNIRYFLQFFGVDFSILDSQWFYTYTTYIVIV